jgi:hypothetical protein
MAAASGSARPKVSPREPASLNWLACRPGPVTVLCRSFDHILCSKGDEPWAQAGRMNFAKMRRE